jgi:putative membrane protein insertion efficiency factor
MTHVMTIARHTLVVPKNLLITLVKGYRLFLSPSLGTGCRFEPTCSAYSLAALQQHGAIAGTYLTLGRLARCHPWCDGGLDPVKPQFSYLPSSWFFVGSSANKDNSRSRLFSRLVTPVTDTISEKNPS